MTPAAETSPTPHPGLDLERVTFDQAKGWRCALCNGALASDRSLGTFTAAAGLLTEPTELWACARPCR